LKEKAIKNKNSLIAMNGRKQWNDTAKKKPWHMGRCRYVELQIFFINDNVKIIFYNKKWNKMKRQIKM
jgi:hypothetical protein